MEEELKDLEKCSILFSKLMCYTHIFYGYEYAKIKILFLK